MGRQRGEPGRRPRLQLESEHHELAVEAEPQTQPAQEPVHQDLDAAAEPEEADNPLASLLGYSEDEEEEVAAPAAAAGAQDTLGEEQPLPQQQQQQQPQEEGEAATGDVAKPTATEGTEAPTAPDDAAPVTTGLQAELDSFLSELQSSGLLEADGASEQPSGTQPTNVAGAGAAAAAGGRSSGAPATEQRVLGPVPGAEGWHRVLDTGSGKVYFWSRATNEVAWQPPTGAAEGQGPGPAEALVPEAAEAAPPKAAAAAAAAAEGAAAVAPAGSKAQAQAGSAAANRAVAGSAVGSHRDALPAGSRGSSGGSGNAVPAGPATLPAGAGAAEAAAARLLAEPSEEVQEAAEEAAQRCEEAAGEWLGSCPHVLRLAIEARCLAGLLQLLAQRQAAAAEQQDVQRGLCWAGFETTLQVALSALERQLPAAVEAAAQLRSLQQQQQQEHHDNEEQQHLAAGPLQPLDAAAATLQGARDGDRGSQLLGFQSVSPQLLAASQGGQRQGLGSDTEEGELPTAEQQPAPLPPLPADNRDVLPPLPAGEEAHPQWDAAAHACPAAAEQVGGPEVQWDVAAYGYPSAAKQAAGQPQAGEAPASGYAGYPGAAEQEAAPLPPDAYPLAELPPLPDADELGPLPARPASQAAAATAAATAGGRASSAGGKRKDKGGSAAGSSKRAKPAAVGGTGLAGKGKGAASLINKWQAMQREAREEAELEAAAAAEAEDPEARAAALQRQRQREAEDWRLAQLRSGAADENPNFAPLAVDWRQRLKQGGGSSSTTAGAAGAAAGAPGPSATATAPTGPETAAGAAATPEGPPDLEALSAALPEGWRAMWDPTHSRVYYGNLATKAGIDMRS